MYTSSLHQFSVLFFFLPFSISSYFLYPVTMAGGADDVHDVHAECWDGNGASSSSEGLKVPNRSRCKHEKLFYAHLNIHAWVNGWMD